MSIARGELAGRILRLLNKSSKVPGVFTPEKIFDAIQEALDAVAMEMFIADQGWLTKMKYIDTVPNQVTVPIGPDMSMIKEVRYLFGDTYYVMTYDDGSGQSMINPQAGAATQMGSRYKIVDNQFYFNPLLAEGGPRYLQVEYMSFPKVASDDGEDLEPQFNNCMDHFMKYRAATILAVGFGKAAGNNEWTALEQFWYGKLLAMVNKRNLQPTTIREFCG
jgi:hypothetical protein